MAKTTTTKGKYVRIQSTINIKVTAGLQYANYTNPDAHIADRLKVGSLWNKTTCLIREGANIYPSEIVEWATVQALVNANVITIGEYMDECNDVSVCEKKEELQANFKEIESKIKDTLPNVE